MNGLAALVVITAGGDIHRVTVAYVAGAAAQLVFMVALAWWQWYLMLLGGGFCAGLGWALGITAAARLTR